MTRSAEIVSGYWRQVKGHWRWIKPYGRYTNGAGVILSLDASAPAYNPPPGDVSSETLAEFGHLLERKEVFLIDFSRALRDGS